jgi:Xaa-Pro aminopeptidase
MTDTALLQEKIAQAKTALQELDIDLWLLAGRETGEMADPSFPLVVGTSVTWTSLFLIGRNGEHLAIVGTGDVESVKATGAWDNVIGYVQSFREPLREALAHFAPRQIALNYSLDNTAADGITYGVFMLLQETLAGTPWADRFISAEPIISRVRGRKSPAEVARIREAIRITSEMFDKLTAYLRPGLTEREISDFLHRQLDEYGLESAWDYNYCPIVSAGPDSPWGHVGPTDITLEPGNLLHIDFGVKYQGYCSDMQRTWYLLRPGESAAPEPCQRFFDIVDNAIQEGAAALRPGVSGREVDAVAREVFAEQGLTWDFAFGHQMGRYCHDGGALLGPAWERYGQRPFDAVEVGHIYTLEIGARVPGYGPACLEDDVIVTENGCEFLGTPQRQIILVGA